MRLLEETDGMAFCFKLKIILAPPNSLDSLICNTDYSPGFRKIATMR